MAFRTQETEGRPTEAKDNQPTSKRTSKILERSPGKSGNDGKGASGAGENASPRSALLAELVLVV